MGVLGVPIYPGGAIRSMYKYLSGLYMAKMVDSPVFSVLTIGNPYTKPHPYDFFFKFAWGLRAGTAEDLKNQVLDNRPHYMYGS